MFQNGPGTLKGENSTALGHPQHLMCRGEQYWTAKANCKPVCSYSLCPHLWFIWRARDLCSHSLWCWYLVPVSLPLFTAPSSVKLKVPVQFANSSPFCQLNCSPLARKRGSWYLITFISSLSARVLVSFFLTQKGDWHKQQQKQQKDTKNHSSLSYSYKQLIFTSHRLCKSLSEHSSSRPNQTGRPVTICAQEHADAWSKSQVQRVGDWCDKTPGPKK